MRPITPVLLTALALGISLPAGAKDETNLKDQQIYGDLVVPILEARCVSCHNPDKDKGDLRLDQYDLMVKDTGDFAAFVPNDIKKSNVLHRITLPLDDVDHMPPEDEKQLTDQEKAVLEFWVSTGAKKDAKVGQLKADEKASKALAHVLDNLPEAPKTEEVAKAEEPGLPKPDAKTQKRIDQTVGRVEELGASLMPIAQNTPELRFSALNVTDDFANEQLAKLKPVSGYLKWIDLARTQVTDEGLAHLSGMKNLTRLHLEKTGITNAGLDHLKGLQNLEYLNLYGTEVGDAGIAKLTGLKKLKKVFLWQSKVTPKGAQKLASAVPNAEINMGWNAGKGQKVALAAADTKKKAGKQAKPDPAPKKKADSKKKPADKKKKSKNDPAPKKKADSKKKPANEKGNESQPGKGDDAFGKALAQLKALAQKTKKGAGEAKTASENAQKAAAQATKKARALESKSKRAAKVAQETRSALDQLQKAAAASKNDKMFGKALAELKNAVAQTKKETDRAKAAYEDAKKASAQAAEKARNLQADSKRASDVAQKTQAALEQLEKAAAARKDQGQASASATPEGTGGGPTTSEEGGARQVEQRPTLDIAPPSADRALAVALPAVTARFAIASRSEVERPPFLTAASTREVANAFPPPGSIRFAHGPPHPGDAGVEVLQVLAGDP